MSESNALVDISRRAWLSAVAAALAMPAWARRTPAAGSDSAPVSWLDEVQRPPAALPADVPRLSPLLIDDAGRSVATVEAWEPLRQRLRQKWLEFLGPMSCSPSGPPTVTVLEEDRPDGVVRQRIRYATEPGATTEAYLIRPAGDPVPLRPGVVVFHSTSALTIRQPAGLEGEPEKAFGLKLARLGYVTISPRCFLWSDEPGTSYPEHVRRFQTRNPQARGMAKMLHDGRVALDVLAAQPGVDGTRLGAVGHSLGAKETLYLAALDPRIRAAVSSEGGIGVRYSNWEAPWYLGDAILQPGFPREHHELLALAAPRPFLLIGGDSADGDRSWPLIEAALSVYRLYGEPAPLGLFNHRQGHAVPPEAERRIAEWFLGYLPVRA